MPKYVKQSSAINNNDLYEELFENRGIKFVKQRRTFTFSGVDLDSVATTEYYWRTGDSLHRISHLFYGTLDYWWVIALVNKKPTDAHYKLGDIVLIPSSPVSIADSVGG